MGKSLKDRLKEEMKIRGVRTPALSEQTGIPKDRIYAWYRDGSSPKSEDQQKLEDWLAGKNSVKNEENGNRGTSGNQQTNYLKTRQDLKNASPAPGVPVHGGFTTLGNLQVYDDNNDKAEVIAILPGNIFPGCDHAEKAKGDSMYPLIMNQALLVGKKCEINGITFGEKYIIKTKEGLDTTKFVHPGAKKGILKLKAYNKSIPDQDVSMEEIIFACRVLWIVNPT